MSPITLLRAELHELILSKIYMERCGDDYDYEYILLCQRIDRFRNQINAIAYTIQSPNISVERPRRRNGALRKMDRIVLPRCIIF